MVDPNQVMNDLLALQEYTSGLNFLHGFFIGLGIPQETAESAVSMLMRQHHNCAEALKKIKIILVSRTDESTSMEVFSLDPFELIRSEPTPPKD